MLLRTLLLAVLSLILSIGFPLRAADREAQSVTTDQPSTPKNQFVRLRRDDNGQLMALDTAIVRYTSSAGRAPVTVDLIGAVHVGEKSYYDRLNQLFATYDALLFELVAPEGVRIPKGGRGRSTHPVSALQRGMKTMLGLEFQLECIDYTKDNFVHADMSPQEFASSMKDRGESFTQMFFRMLGQGIALQSKDPGRSQDAQLLMALFSKDRAMRLKRVLAQQFEDMDRQIGALNGANGSTLITERNKKALEVLAREIRAGKKRIAIFYGAGHLPDMEQRLLSDFQMRRTNQQWLEAWALSAASLNK